MASRIGDARSHLAGQCCAILDARLAEGPDELREYCFKAVSLQMESSLLIRCATSQILIYPAFRYQIPWALYGFGPWLFYNRIGRSLPCRREVLPRASAEEGASLPVGASRTLLGRQARSPTWCRAGADLMASLLFDAGFVAHPSSVDFPLISEKLARPVSFAAPATRITIYLWNKPRRLRRSLRPSRGRWES